MAGFLQEFKTPDILLGVIAKSRNPRLTVSTSSPCVHIVKYIQPLHLEIMMSVTWFSFENSCLKKTIVLNDILVFKEILTVVIYRCVFTNTEEEHEILIGVLGALRK